MSEHAEVGPFAQVNMLFAQRKKLPAIPVRNREHWFQILDDITPDAVLGYIAEGNLPIELAIDNGIPPLYLREWMAERLDPKRLQLAMASHAEAAVLKATLVNSALPDDPAEATAQKELAASLRWQAERANPDRWGPPRKSDAAPPPVNIVLNIPRLQQEKVIDHDQPVTAAPALPIRRPAEDWPVHPAGAEPGAGG